jgi:hypothetical protein
VKLLYVSGPMTGKPLLNFQAFNAAAEALRRAGYAVVNPVDLNPDPAAEWLACMRNDIKALVHCDGIALLPGWTESRGARIEAQIAEALGMTLWGVDQWLAASARRAA